MVINKDQSNPQRVNLVFDEESGVTIRFQGRLR